MSPATNTSPDHLHPAAPDTPFDLVFVGHFAQDKIVVGGQVETSSGGSVYYGAIAAARLGYRVAIVTRLHPDQFWRLDEVKAAGVAVFAAPAPQTSGIENTYLTADMDRRLCKPLGFAGPFRLEDIPDLHARTWIVGPIIAGEIDLPLLKALAGRIGRARLALDVQGFVRVPRGDDLVSIDWPEKAEGLAVVDMLKVDHAEAEVLTGEPDVRVAATVLAGYGPREILLTHAGGVLVYADGEFHSAPFRARSLRGRTGRGDTCFATYLARRQSAQPGDAARFAAAVTSLKMETPGPFAGSSEDVERYLAAEREADEPAAPSLDPASFVRPEIRSQSAYTLRQPPHDVKLNQNENPLGFPADVKEEVFARLREVDWARYPDFHLDQLTRGLARHAGAPPDWLLPGNGSNELLQMTLLACLSPGDAVVLPVPSFSLYRLQSVFMGGRVVPVQLSPEDGFALPVEPVIRAAQAHRAKIVVLCSPNNPTANTYPEAAIRRVVEESGALVLLDEAYREFSDQDFLPLLREYPNVVLFRTFSKARAMAGLRVGYMLARPELVREVGKVKLPYGLNIMSETATLVALEHPDVFAAQVAELRRLRDVLLEQLAGVRGIHPYPSQANWVLVRCDLPAETVFRHLAEDGILVRDVSSYPGLDGHLRLSVGSAEEDAALVASLRRLAVPGSS